ncbi:MAG: methyltransferase domain-containing protein [SAR202 cluster bacterium]|jgi:SAM-dependent methyltransferase|nr:methyltransferase domain-containing protein [SAR202 cluster bacterium]MDP6513002.1 methyltransferase domain-containing protein [SAR202 cluster bacterium]MDP6713187.1 methyltransferase domain-containing protein [SAR202 cluster bacterium]
MEDSLYPRSQKYDLDWMVQNSMGPNVIWLTEALTDVMTLEPGMRVLDMGCGKAVSSIFLAKEFDVEVWAADLWIKPTENWERIREAGLENQVYPIYAEARSLPFADDFFDAIVSLDSYHYYGTDVHYLEFYILKHLKRGGQIGIVSPASPVEIPIPPPEHLGVDWHWMNSVDWWARHWGRYPDVDIELCEVLPHGWESWVRWHEISLERGRRDDWAEPELRQLREDQGRYLNFMRMVGRRALDEVSINTTMIPE